MRLSQSISLLIVVAVAAVFTAANAHADLITYTYDFDRCTANQLLNGQDNWKFPGTLTVNNTTVLSGSALWSGNYISAVKDGANQRDCTNIRQNDSGWSFTLLPDTDFEFSAMFNVGSESSTNGYMAHFGIGKYDPATNNSTNMIYFGTQYHRLRWGASAGIGLTDLYYTHGISDTTGTGGKIFNIGVEMKAQGNNQYKWYAFYQNMTDSGTRQYYDYNNPVTVTVDASQWDVLYARTYNKYVNTTKSYLACIDTLSITTTAPIPEPSTAVLLLGGLLGLAAYAWRKRK
jgi:hypothetical protein